MRTEHAELQVAELLDAGAACLRVIPSALVGLLPSDPARVEATVEAACRAALQVMSDGGGVSDVSKAVRAAAIEVTHNETRTA